jgi:hypothetical protein
MRTQAVKEPKKGDDDFTWQDILYFITGSVIYYYVCPPMAHLISKNFGYIDTESDLFDNLYYRYYVHTKFLSIHQWIYYGFMLITGFMFINIVNLKNVRKNPFAGPRKNFYDIKFTIFLCFFVFIFSGVVVLRQKHDLSSFCDKNHHHHNHSIPANQEINVANIDLD